ncbi:MAG: hypothetical protein B5M51_08475 [Anaerolinea sp. 4484_236]|nr:MAG: hypothetical protein B5M51_08475 [Anaerolinea sp. 4484_236]RLD05603.1 MAG: hypothetical protein DRI56_09280 [Chloroflexota bacterium]
MNPKRGNWYLLTAVIMGVCLGLFYAWTISPSHLKETHPYVLRSDYKDVYRALIASAFQTTGDLPRAEARLALLKDDEPAFILAAQAQRILAEGGDYREAKALANLSAALLGGNVQVAYSPTPTIELPPSTLTPTPTLPPSLTPLPPAAIVTTPGEEEISTTTTVTVTPAPTSTLTPTFTPIPPFILQEDSGICDATLKDTPLIQIYATDRSGQGVPGVEIRVTRAREGQESFFTGLKPEFGLGYADFEMTPGVVYMVELLNSGIQVSEITAKECSTEGGEDYWGSWQIFVTIPE